MQGIVMLARLVLIVIVLASNSGLAFAAIANKAESIVQTKNTAKFIGINSIGNINLNLHTQASKNKVILKGDSRDLAYMNLQVKDGILQLKMGKGYPKFGPVTVDTYSKYLSSLNYKGSGVIAGKKIRANLINLNINNDGQTMLDGTVRLGHLELKGNGYTEINNAISPKLQLILADNAKLRLKGRVDVRAIDMSGNSWLSTYWVKSTTLFINACDNAFVQTAGIVNKMDANISGNARLDAKYLRARTAFVKTFGSSVADISVIKTQHTLASDNSDINFYNLPDMKTNFMAFDGSVLDMRAILSPYVEEPSHYNKGVPQS